MTQVISYRTSYFSNKYQILKDSLQIGNLYKTEWLGCTIEASLNEQKFSFVSKGILHPSITIINPVTNTTVGTIEINHLLSFHQTAILTLQNGSKYYWTCNNFFTNDWQWTSLINSEIVFKSVEPLDIFKQNGTITFSNNTQDTELFITLGIHLRNFAKRKSHLTKIMGFVILITLLPRYFR